MAQDVSVPALSAEGPRGARAVTAWEEEEDVPDGKATWALTGRPRSQEQARTGLHRETRNTQTRASSQRLPGHRAPHSGTACPSAPAPAEKDPSKRGDRTGCPQSDTSSFKTEASSQRRRRAFYLESTCKTSVPP